MIEFITFDITVETDAEEVNRFLRENNISGFFIMDVNPTLKMLWAHHRAIIDEETATIN